MTSDSPLFVTVTCFYWNKLWNVLSWNDGVDKFFHSSALICIRVYRRSTQLLVDSFFTSGLGSHCLSSKQELKWHENLWAEHFIDRWRHWSAARETDRDTTANEETEFIRQGGSNNTVIIFISVVIYNDSNNSSNNHIKCSHSSNNNHHNHIWLHLK